MIPEATGNANYTTDHTVMVDTKALIQMMKAVGYPVPENAIVRLKISSGGNSFDQEFEISDLDDGAMRVTWVVTT